MKLKKLSKKLSIGIALVMVCASLCGTASANIPPAPQGNISTYVFDYTGRDLISSEDTRVINEFAQELERQTGAQAVVVLVNFLDGEEIGIYAHDLFNAWGIGQKGKDNGLLLLCARGEREVFLYPGSGIDNMLTPGICDRVLADYAVPKLSHGDYSGGLRDAFLAACDRLARSYGVTLSVTGGAAAPSTSIGLGGSIEDIINGFMGFVDNIGGSNTNNNNNTNNRNNDRGGSWVGTLVVIVILFFVLGGGRRRRFRMGGGGGCFPFLLGGFLGSTLRRGPMGGGGFRPGGGFKPTGGGFKPTGGSKPGGFKPGGGMGRGGGAGRKF